MDEFVGAVAEVFPEVMLQFKDFSADNAIAMLDRYKDRMAVFNDDIQGTAVALAGILSALRITGGALEDQRVLFVGAGSANIGIDDLVAGTIAQTGLSMNEGRDRIKPHAETTGITATVAALQPTILIGATGQPSIFDQATLNGKTHILGQSNTVYIFSGISLGVTACRISRVTTEMFRLAGYRGCDCGACPRQLSDLLRTKK